VALPTVKAAKPAVILAPQPKRPSRLPPCPRKTTTSSLHRAVHLGETFGVTPIPTQPGRPPLPPSAIPMAA